MWEDARVDPGDGYREAMLQGAGLAWDARWEAAAAAFRRALAARPGDVAAERQLALTRNKAGLADPSSVDSPAAPEPARNGDRAGHDTASDLFGRTASAHIGELATLPPDLVRKVVEGMRSIERDQAAGHSSAAFDRAYTLLQQAPTFLPLHILLAELYIETGQWQAGREKLEAVEAAYAARDGSGSEAPA